MERAVFLIRRTALSVLFFWKLFSGNVSEKIRPVYN